MKLIIDKRDKIDTELIKQGQQHSPWDGFRLDFDNEDTENKYMHFLKSQLIAVLENNGKLLSFAGFGHDERFTDFACNITKTPAHESAFFMYFFTPENLRKNGYGKILYDGVLKYLKTNTECKYLIYSTGNIENIRLYQNWGAQQNGIDYFENEKQYYFTHELT